MLHECVKVSVSQVRTCINLPVCMYMPACVCVCRYARVPCGFVRACVCALKVFILNRGVPESGKLA